MKKTRDTKSILLRVLLYLFVILVVLVTLYPYFVMFTTATKSRAEIYSTDGTLLPIHWLWQNFKDIWTLAPLSRYFINSLIVAGGSTLIAIVCGIPAAYALARMKFKGKKNLPGNCHYFSDVCTGCPSGRYLQNHVHFWHDRQSRRAGIYQCSI